MEKYYPVYGLRTATTLEQRIKHLDQEVKVIKKRDEEYRKGGPFNKGKHQKTTKSLVAESAKRDKEIEV